MGKQEKLLARILRGVSDANIPFDDLVALLLRLNFIQRVRGSHHIFVKEGIREMLNLQQEGHLAKPYQVRQIRKIIVEYHLEVDES